MYSLYLVSGITKFLGSICSPGHSHSFLFTTINLEIPQCRQKYPEQPHSCSDLVILLNSRQDKYANTTNNHYPQYKTDEEIDGGRHEIYLCTGRVATPNKTRNLPSCSSIVEIRDLWHTWEKNQHDHDQ